MSNRSKGQEIERKAQRMLEENGWLVQRAPPSYRWNKQTDLFGLFDIISLKKEEKKAYDEINGIFLYKILRKYVQIKTNRKPTKIEKDDLVRFKNGYCGKNDSVEWWCYWKRGKRKKNRGFEIIYL